jgi:hypothetical protein
LHLTINGCIMDVDDSCPLSPDKPGCTPPPRQAVAVNEDANAKGREMLAFAERMGSCKLLVIIRHGKVVHWHPISHKSI